MLSGCDLEQKLAKALDRIGKGAAALSEAGATVYNMSSAVQKQGISGLLQPETWKQGVSQYPVKHSVRRIAPAVPYQPEDLDERRAILQVRLEKAMQRQDVVCVQQLSHELDKLEGAHCKDLKSFGGSFTAADTVLRPTATVPARRIALPAGAIDHMRADRHLAEQWDTVPLASSTGVVHQCTDAMCTSTASDARPGAPRQSYPFSEQLCHKHLHGVHSHYNVPDARFHHEVDHTGRLCNGPHGDGKEEHGNALYQGSTVAGDAQSVASSAMAPCVHPAMMQFASLPEWHPTEHNMRPPSSGVAHIVSNRTGVSVIAGVHAASGAQRADIDELSSQLSFAMAGHPWIYQVSSLDGPDGTFQLPAASSRVSSEPKPPLRMPYSSVSRSLQSNGFGFQLEPSRGGENHMHSGAGLSSDSTPTSQALSRPMHPSGGALLLNMHSPPVCAISASQGFVQTGGQAQVGTAGLPLACVEEVPDETYEHRAEETAPFAQDERDALLRLCNKSYENEDKMDGESVGLPALPDVYEVDKVLDMRLVKDNRREFLIKWKGWGPKWNNWEPEEHILDRRMISKFDRKRKAGPAPLASPLGDADNFSMQSKRRCAKTAAVKARTAARKELSDDGL